MDKFAAMCKPMQERMQVRIEWRDAMSSIASSQWNALLVDDHPFVRHQFLAALETSGSLRAELGWRAHHLTLWHDEQLIGAAPCYVKGNSHGEFVFDWNWAEAYEGAGGRYYPKLLCAVPYSPVTGPRLLAGSGDNRHDIQRQLIAAMRAHCDARKWSSVHLNFATGEEAAQPQFADDAWLPRFDWQYHWRNRGYADFDAFLAALIGKKRKNIRQERARFRTGDWLIERVPGKAIDAELMGDIYHFYASTFIAKGNVPALTRAFFDQLLSALPESVLAVVATRNGERIGAAFCLRSSDTLYGRYWGCSEEVPGLHFECCYYQGIEYCIEQGLQTFEPGAQGEHKIARGFLPTRMHSRHYLRDPGFRDAIAEYLQQEEAHQLRYRDLLLEHSPFSA